MSHFFTIMLIVLLISLTKKNSIDTFKENSDLQLKLYDKNKLLSDTNNQLIHDVKSPLTALKLLSENEKQNSLLKMATHRVEEIILSLEGDNQVNSKKIINVKKIISYLQKEKNCKLLIDDQRKAAHDNNLQLVGVSSSDFSRILSNIINNAIEATQNIDNEIKIIISRVGSQLKICVKDKGPGVAPDQINDILKQGYTTKETGKGLGLSHAFEVLKNNNGSLEIVNNNGLEVHLEFEVVDV